MSHMVLLTVVALSWRRPRAHILIACGTQRGGANSDALSKFQFRDVGLLAILIGNVHCFPFSLLVSMQTDLVCFFAPVPSIYDAGVYYMGQVMMSYPNCTRVKD